MKVLFLFLSLVTTVCIKVTAQKATDFYVAISKSATNDTLHIYVSVQKHQNISYETLAIQIREKGVEIGNTYQVSSRFPYGIINNMNVYKYPIPFLIKSGVPYEISLNNNKLCNEGPFKIENIFSSDTIRTYSYANPGYKLVQDVKVYATH